MASDTGYIRPPLVADEPPSPRQLKRRGRLILFVIALAVAAGAYLLARALLDGGEGNPAIGNAASSTPAAVTALTAG